jgi:imidazolonepropionase-like amidohydrolase
LAFTELPVIMPGMWDVHTHFMGSNIVADLRDSFKTFMPGNAALIGAVIVDDLRATLMAGFTSIRELGGYAGDVFPAVQKGAPGIVGPNVYSSFALLSITGGHGDQHDVPLGLVVDSGTAGGPFALCDGVESCIRTVRQTVRRGAKVIKVCSTGGVLSLYDQPEDTQFSPAELRAIVEEAARSGRVVAAHAIGKPGIMAALEAGVKSIEHGMYLDEEIARVMIEKDAILVPTRQIVEGLNANPDGLAPPSLEKMRRMARLSRDSVKLAVKMGVKIALGTDSFSSDKSHPVAHGKNAKELHWAVQAGMTPLQAIEMATAVAPETLGPQAPKAGALKAGYDADIIAVAKDPLEDIEVLTNPVNITHVWKGGILYKSP